RLTISGFREIFESLVKFLSKTRIDKMGAYFADVVLLRAPSWHNADLAYAEEDLLVSWKIYRMAHIVQDSFRLLRRGRVFQHKSGTKLIAGHLLRQLPQGSKAIGDA